MQPAKTSVDTLIDARWVIPVEPPRLVLSEHTVVVDAGQIIVVLPTAQAHSTFSAAHTVSLNEHVLLPGLINLHTHAAMSLMRGFADDLALLEWLRNYMWPTEMRHVSNEFVYDGTRLACAEMLRAGVTCFNDMYFFPEATARAALRLGMRASVGVIVLESPSPYATDAQDYLNKGLALRDEHRGQKLLAFCLAPHSPYMVSTQSLQRIATYASELDLSIHMHVHETRDEIELSLKEYGVRPLLRLAEIGLLGPNLIAVHAIHLEPSEIELLAKHACHVAHCPSSNLKLASGIAPIATLLGAGINVGIGTDSAVSNNRLDVLTEMRLAALLAKGISGEPTAVPAWQALELATIRAARALGLDGSIGTLTPGKCADITALRLSGAELAPCFDVLSNVVYAAGREHVTHVWIDGRLIVDDGNLTTIEVEEVTAKAAHWRDKIRTP